jgi:hypothetical protein
VAEELAAGFVVPGGGGGEVAFVPGRKLSGWALVEDEIGGGRGDVLLVLAARVGGHEVGGHVCSCFWEGGWLLIVGDLERVIGFDSVHSSWCWFEWNGMVSTE